MAGKLSQLPLLPSIGTLGMCDVRNFRLVRAIIARLPSPGAALIAGLKPLRCQERCSSSMFDGSVFIFLCVRHFNEMFRFVDVSRHLFIFCPSFRPGFFSHGCVKPIVMYFFALISFLSNYWLSMQCKNRLY